MGSELNAFVFESPIACCWVNLLPTSEAFAMRFERWRAAPPPQSMRPYNTVQDSRFHHTEYEDPDYYYSCPPESVQTKTMDFPPPLPPLPPQATFDSGRVLIGGGKSSASSTLTPHKEKHHRRRRNTKLYLVGACLTLVSLVLVAAIIGFLILRPPQNLFGALNRATARPSPLIHAGTEEAVAGSSSRIFTQSPSQVAISQSPRVVDRVIEANNLLTHIITKRKLCIFETSSDRVEFSRQQFREDHVEGARLLFFTNLSHSGVPVHPLQFQRYVRNLGVDGDCHVVLYDRGQQIWATYAFWIFTLFGHKKVSLLNGGYDEWKRHQLSSAQYRTETGPGAYVQHIGTFQSEWRSDVILTFDDVIANADTRIYDVVDAQTREEFDGRTSGAVYGHIRSAVNIPVDDVYDFHENHWRNTTQLSQLFETRGLTANRPVVVYCSTSIRATAVWWALMRQNFRAAIYFGSWPEWLIRAPDYLKVIPDKRAPPFVNITDIQN